MLRNRMLLVLAVVGVLTAGTAVAASLDVNGTAARQGAFGLGVTFDGTTQQAFVSDDSPSGEKVYYATFYLNINDLNMAPCDDHQLFRGRQTAPTGQTPFRIHIYRTCQDIGDLSYNILPFIQLDNGTWVFDAATFSRPGSNHVFTFEWRAATSPGANDGTLKIYKGQNLVYERNNLDNDTFAIDRVDLGAVAAVDTATSGTIYIDEFLSTRTPQF